MVQPENGLYVVFGVPRFPYRFTVLQITKDGVVLEVAMLAPGCPPCPGREVLSATPVGKRRDPLLPIIGERHLMGKQLRVLSQIPRPFAGQLATESENDKDLMVVNAIGPFYHEIVNVAYDKGGHRQEGHR